MNHALLPVTLDQAQADLYRLVPPVRAFSCYCGWTIMAGRRGDQEDLVLALVATFKGEHQRGRVYRLKPDAPIDAMVSDIVLRGCPAMYRASRLC